MDFLTCLWITLYLSCLSRRFASVRAELHHSSRDSVRAVWYCGVGDTTSGQCWVWRPVWRFQPPLWWAARKLSQYCCHHCARLPQHLLFRFPGPPSVSLRQRSDNWDAWGVFQQCSECLSGQHLFRLQAQTATRGWSLQSVFTSTSGEESAQSSVQVRYLLSATVTIQWHLLLLLSLDVLLSENH